MSEERLDRIENKLDDMSKAIVALARIEERMITLFKRMDVLDEVQRENSDRLRKVENASGNNGQMLRFAERIFWIVVSGGIGYLFWLMKGQ